MWKQKSNFSQIYNIVLLYTFILLSVAGTHARVLSNTQFLGSSHRHTCPWGDHSENSLWPSSSSFRSLHLLSYSPGPVGSVCVCVAERSCSLKQSDRLNYRNSDCDLVPSLSAVTSKDWDFWCVREVLDLFFFNHIAASAVTWSSLVKPKLNLSSNIPQNVLVHSGARRKITSQQLYECVLHKCDQKCNNTSTAVWCTLFWSPYIWHQANIWSRQ